MKMSFKNFSLVIAAMFFAPTLAHAHTGVGAVHGVANGLLHPLTGLDHLCAMIAVGLWAAQRGGRALWAVPLTFVCVMTFGAALGMAGIGLPLVETGIIASVLILGVLVAAAVRLPLPVSMGIVGLFALCHGHAHGAEMPATASGFTYGIGFVAMTVMLHLAGIGLGLAMQKFGSEKMLRCTGGAVAACGLYLCLAA